MNRLFQPALHGVLELFLADHGAASVQGHNAGNQHQHEENGGPGADLPRGGDGKHPRQLSRAARRSPEGLIGFRAAMRFYEYEARKIVELAGIPVTRYGFCTSAEEA